MHPLLPGATSADEKARAATCAILPVESFEQHGDYLPLITDTVVACVIAEELANAHPVLELPPVTISCSHEHSAWAGTVSCCLGSSAPCAGNFPDRLLIVT